MAQTVRRAVLIANPTSGRGQGAGVAASAAAILRERGIELDVRLTSAAGEAVELAKQVAGEPPDLLLTLGGDGTIRDVAEGLAGAPVPVGILPFGTGNDLARTLGISREPRAALEIALSGVPRSLDVWLWNNTPFVNIAGIGLDAAVAYTVNRRFHHLKGTAAYLAGFLAVFPRFQPFQLRLRAPSEEWSGLVWLAAFANAVSYGGGMKIAPNARPDDGLLDVIIIEAIPRGELLREFPRIFGGTHVRNPRVRVLRVDRIEVDTAPTEATIDGEMIASAPAKITRRDGPFIVRCPPP